MAHQNLGMDLLMRIKGDFVETAKVELEPRLEGRQMTMVLAPKSA
jgi:translation initiation factor IF-3